METNPALATELFKHGSVVLDHGEQPSRDSDWGVERSIDAASVRDAVLGRSPGGERPGPVRLCGVRIVGPLSLQGVTLPDLLVFDRCCFDVQVDLNGARGGALHLPGCFLSGGLDANRIELRSFLDLTRGFASDGGIFLNSARVRGLNLTDARLGTTDSAAAGRAALSADRLTVDVSMLCRGLEAHGEVNVRGMRIGGQVNLQEANLACPDGYSLNAYSATVGGALLCNEGFHSTGEISLLDAEVAGQVNFRGAHLVNRSGKPVISGYHLTAGGALHLDNGFHSEGGSVIFQGCVVRRSFEASKAEFERGLDFVGATVTGNVNLEGSTLRSDAQRVLNAERATVGGSVYLREGFEAEGEVNLSSIGVRHQLSLTGARLINPGGPALLGARMVIEGSFYADKMHAQGSVSLRGTSVGLETSFDGVHVENPGKPALILAGGNFAGGFRAIRQAVIEGELNVQGTRVGDLFDLSGLRLSNPDGLAIRGSRLKVEGSAFFREGFRSEGEIVLRGARIGSELSFSKAVTNGRRTSIDLYRAKMGALRLTQAERPSGKIILRDATTTAFLDNPATWPEALDLDGFSYESLAPAEPLAQRMAWLERAQPEDGFNPGLYDQLGAFYRRHGREEDAVELAIARERRRRSKLSWPGKLWNVVLDGAVGYGYKSHRAFGALLGLVILDFILFSLLSASFHDTDTSTDFPTFSALAFSVDAVLPVIELGQERNWAPSGFAEAWYWVSVLSGWLLTTVLIAALTGLLKRTSR